jgi:hypothetical protein
MSDVHQYQIFLRSIGPFSFEAIIRGVADLRYGFAAWLRRPDTRAKWKATILRHMQLTCAPASDSAPASHSVPAFDSAPAPSAAPVSSAALAQQLHHMQMATLQECFEMADAMIAAGIHDLHSLKGLSSEDLEQRLRGVYSFGALHIQRIQLFNQGVSFPLVFPLGTKRACPAPSYPAPVSSASPQAHTVNTFYPFSRHHFASFISTGSCGRHHRIGSASSSYREHILSFFTP